MKRTYNYVFLLVVVISLGQSSHLGAMDTTSNDESLLERMTSEAQALMQKDQKEVKKFFSEDPQIVWRNFVKKVHDNEFGIADVEKTTKFIAQMQEALPQLVTLVQENMHETNLNNDFPEFMQVYQEKIDTILDFSIKGNEYLKNYLE